MLNITGSGVDTSTVGSRSMTPSPRHSFAEPIASPTPPPPPPLPPPVVPNPDTLHPGEYNEPVNTVVLGDVIYAIVSALLIVN